MILFPPDENEIYPLLHQGSAPPGNTVLMELGFSAVVLCAIENQPPASKFEGIDVLYAPNDDNPLRAPTRDELLIAVDAAKQVAQRVQDGQKVLVTCMAGLNRSGLVNAFALHILTGWSGPRCVQQVQAKRQAALSNRQFVRVLSRIRSREVAATP